MILFTGATGNVGQHIVPYRPSTDAVRALTGGPGLAL